MIPVWSPSEWQGYANALLAAHYGPTNYLIVPDQHKGDAGLEGFSLSGHAYQCYAAQDSRTLDQLADKQKRKIYNDTRKFIENRGRLLEILGDVKVCRWMLMVPEHVSSEVVAYCHTRRTAIVRESLPYVDPDDFYVGIATDGEFPVERQALATRGLGRIALGTTPTTEAEVDAWVRETQGSAEIQTVRRKLRKLPRLADADALTRTERRLLLGYVHGQRVLSDLKDQYPQLFERVRTLRAAREQVLALESELGQTHDGQLIDELRSMEKRLSEELPALRPDHHAELGLHAVADWLLRCPLDFPGHEQH